MWRSLSCTPPFSRLPQRTRRQEGALEQFCTVLGRGQQPRSRLSTVLDLGSAPNPTRPDAGGSPWRGQRALSLGAKKSALSPRWSTWGCPSPPAHLFPIPAGVSGLEKCLEFGWLGELGRWNSTVTFWDNSSPNPHQRRDGEERD